MRVLTIGTFDLLHRGHLNLFQRCMALGALTIGVNSDHFVLKYKGVVPMEDEITRLGNCSEHAPSSLHIGATEQFILCEQPDVIVVGSDWAERPYLEQLGVTQQWLNEQDISVMYVPYTEGISSTQLRNEQMKGDFVPLL